LQDIRAARAVLRHLATDGRINIDGEKNVSWYMIRTD
jgi:hypothetical protein